MEEYDEKEVFDYLLGLRDSGVTNMFGAGSFLEEQFGMNQSIAKEWLVKWMGSC